jgi:hypothetical protein
MNIYKLRYFFDPGSGICLWSANDLARETYGYAVNHEALGLPPAVGNRIAELIALFDTSIDWDCPMNPSPWSNAELAGFQAAAAELLQSLKGCLGSDFEISDAGIRT